MYFASSSRFHYDLEHRPFLLVRLERCHFVVAVDNIALHVIFLLTHIAVAQDIEVQEFVVTLVLHLLVVQVAEVVVSAIDFHEILLNLESAAFGVRRHS